MKELPIQGSRALAKLFQEAWKKGAEAEQVSLRPVSNVEFCMHLMQFKQ